MEKSKKKCSKNKGKIAGDDQDLFQERTPRRVLVFLQLA